MFFLSGGTRVDIQRIARVETPLLPANDCEGGLEPSESRKAGINDTPSDYQY
jgi:hypothetical protein